MAVKDALCMADAIRVMGDQPKASTWRRARLTVERFQIDTSHLRPQEVEVDHIDGDPWNNLLDNLRLLCPNCHALTKTYRGRNIGRTNGRPRAPTETSAEEGPEQQGG